MYHTRFVLPVVIVAALWAGCSKRQTAMPAERQATTSKTLLTLEGRSRTIVITTGPDGPRYTMTDSDGTVIFTELDSDQLRVQHPDVHRKLDTAVATDAGLRDARR